MNQKTKSIIIIISILVILGIISFILFLLFRSDSGYALPKGDLKWGCSYDFYNCDDLQTQAEAQEIFETCGGIENDIHLLDKDGNGIACEGLV